MPTLLKHINPIYFWDVDFNSIDEKKSQRLIIERIISLGNLHEIKQVISYYGKDIVIKTICNLNHLDRKNLNFWSLIFSIPKSKFKCYIRKRSANLH